MEPLRNWKKLQRHPLSAVYGDLKPRARERMRAGLLKWGILNERKITLHEGMVLDAWQLYSLCLEEGIEPAFQPLPEGIEPADWVEMMNDTRRHEPDEVVEARVAARRERVAAARQNGKSLRTIAEAEDISEATVRRDLEAAGTAPPGAVLGKDDRKQPATKPKKPHKPKPPETADDGEPEEPAPDLNYDGYGNEIPEHLIEVFAARLLLKECLTLGRRLAQRIDRLARHEGGRFLRPNLERRGKTEESCRFVSKDLRQCLDLLKQHAPHSALCPRCHHEHPDNVNPNCPLCQGEGWLTLSALRFAERPHREAVEALGKARKEATA